MRYAIVRVHSNDKSDYIIMHAPTWTVTAVSAVAQLIRALNATREYKQKVTSRLKTCQAEHSCASHPNFHYSQNVVWELTNPPKNKTRASGGHLNQIRGGSCAFSVPTRRLQRDGVYYSDRVATAPRTSFAWEAQLPEKPRLHCAAECGQTRCQCGSDARG